MSAHRFLAIPILVLAIFIVLSPCAIRAQTWEPVKLLPVPLVRHVAAVSSDKDGNELLFVFGGISSNNFFSSTTVYDPASKEWDITTYEPLPTPRANPTETVDSDGKIWVIGGADSSQALNIVEVFDPVDNFWTTMPPLNIPRRLAAAATDKEGRIFVFGGTDGDGGVVLDSVEMYDPKTGEWTPRAPMPEAHAGIGAELGCDGLIYVMGRDESDLTRAFNLAYDPENNTWDRKSTPPLEPGANALGGRGMTVGPNGRIYLVNDGVFLADPRVFSYDPANDQWRREPDTAAGHLQLAVATLGDRVFAIGGNMAIVTDPRFVESLGPIADLDPCSPTCVLPPSGMVSWLTFDERAGAVAADLIAGNNGAHVQSPLPTEGLVGEWALSFEGPGHVAVPHDPRLNFGAGDFSIDMWLRDPTHGNVLSKFDPNNERGFELFLFDLGDEGIEPFLTLNESQESFAACRIPPDDAWHHLALIVDRENSEIRCHVDGQFRQANPILGEASVNNASTLLVGADAHLATDFEGVVDELELFNRALSDVEVQAIAAASDKGKCKDFAHPHWDTTLCGGQANDTVHVNVCNYSPAVRHYELELQYLPAGTFVEGQMCDIDGPMLFQAPGPPATRIPPAVEVSVPPQTCEQVPIRVWRPTGMRAAGQRACYQAISTKVETGGTAISTAFLIDRRDTCWVFQPWGGSAHVIDTFEQFSTTVEIANFASVDTVLDYSIEPMPEENDPERAVLGLNGQEPGTPVEGSLTIPAGGIGRIPLEAVYVRPDPLRFQDVVVSTRREGQEDFVPLGSITLRNPLPGDAEAKVRLGDTVWNDENGDGIQANGEEGLAGVTVRLLDGDGVTVLGNSTTDRFGAYAFRDLEPGDYVVAVDPSTLPEGWEQTFDADRVLDNRSAVSLDGGEAHAGLDFGYRLAPVGVEVFTDREAWEEAVGGFVCETFENEALAPFEVAPTPFTTAGGVLLETINRPAEVDIQYLNPGLIDETGELHFRDFAQGVKITPPGPEMAFAFDFDTAIEAWELEALGTSKRLDPNQTGFIGFVANAPIESFNLTGEAGAQGGISIDNLCRPTEVSKCVPSDTTLCLHDGRIEVEVDWRIPAGATGSGRAEALSTESGYFSFFESDNVELAVKVLDGRTVNGFWWIFYGALSNVEYTLRVTEVETGMTATYFNSAGEFSSVGDIRAIPKEKSETADGGRFIEVGRDEPNGLSYSRGPFITEARRTEPASPAGATSVGPEGSCQPGPTTLCLSGSRFEVEVEWTDFQGNRGSSMAVPIKDGSGYWWYLEDANIELVTKIVDGRQLNGHWWFFYASLSNIEFTISVTDTVTGATRAYVNPLAAFMSGGDTTAFAE